MAPRAHGSARLAMVPSHSEKPCTCWSEILQNFNYLGANAKRSQSYTSTSAGHCRVITIWQKPNDHAPSACPIQPTQLQKTIKRVSAAKPGTCKHLRHCDQNDERPPTHCPFPSRSSYPSPLWKHSDGMSTARNSDAIFTLQMTVSDFIFQNCPRLVSRNLNVTGVCWILCSFKNLLCTNVGFHGNFNCILRMKGGFVHLQDYPPKST